MNLDKVSREVRRGAMMRVVLRGALLACVLVAGTGWLLLPDANFWSQARAGISQAAGQVRTVAILALGGTPETPAPTTQHKRTELDGLKRLNGFAVSEIRCLALAIYFEAGRESREAQIAVGQIAVNRAKERKAPREICRVVYHGVNVQNGCLFDATCRNLGNPPISGASLTQSIEVAQALVRGEAAPGRLAGASHFHERGNRPAWARTLFKLATIGRLEFYSTDQPDNVATAPPLDPSEKAEPAARQSPPRRATTRQEAQRQDGGGSGSLGRQVFGID